ncbi:MAG: protein-S-isoprenylcysteine O-methyltransferase [Pseudomonadota bacterium]
MTVVDQSTSKRPLVGQLLAMAIYLGFVGLALWRWEEIGWGGLVWLAGSLMTSVIRAPYAKAITANTIVDDRQDTGEKILLAGMYLGMGLLPTVHLATGLFSFAEYHLPSWATALGAALHVLFLWLFWRSHADLGRNWSVTLEIRDEHELVTHGVYTYIRHPMYAAIWLAALAQPLLVPNWIAGCMVLVAFSAMYVVRAPREEAMMRDKFGQAYDDYAQTTGRLLPRVI